MENMDSINERAFKKIANKNSLSPRPSYVIQSKRKFLRIFLDDIILIQKEKYGKNTEFHCQNGTIYKKRETLQNIFYKLPKRQFVYVNRCQIVNLRYIESEIKGQIKISGMECIYISETLLSKVRHSLAEYWQ